MYVDADFFSAARAANSAGPNSLDPKTRRARSRGVSSTGVSVVDVKVLDDDAEDPESGSCWLLGFRFAVGDVAFEGSPSLGTCFFPGGSTSGLAEFGGSSGLTSGIKGGDLKRLS